MGVLKQLATGGAAIALGALVFASLAFASSHHPKGEFAQFDQCPLGLKTINDCVYSVSNRGSFTVGKKTVPLKNPVTLQGGFEGSGSEIKVLGAENGETLSETPQSVPGGLLGITAPTWWPVWLQEWFNEGIESGQTGVTATLELAARASSIELSTENLIFEKGTAIGLPVRIKLANPMLGDNCYIGSDSEPVQIDFTTGKGGALTGTTGKSKFNKEFTLTTITGGRLVNGTFTAPSASGCGGIFSSFIDPFVNSTLGLPSGKGENSSILEGKFQDAAASAVRESE